jgi:hypothetical protein
MGCVWLNYPAIRLSLAASNSLESNLLCNTLLNVAIDDIVFTLGIISMRCAGTSRNSPSGYASQE